MPTAAKRRPSAISLLLIRLLPAKQQAPLSTFSRQALGKVRTPKKNSTNAELDQHTFRMRTQGWGLIMIQHNLFFLGMKYSQQIPCDNLGSIRYNGGDRGLGGRLVASPVQLEPSHTLLETHHPKPVRTSIMVISHLRLVLCRPYTTHHHHHHYVFLWSQVSGGGPLPPVSTLTSLHNLSASPASQGLIMASLPSVMSLGESSLLIGNLSYSTQQMTTVSI